MTDIKKVLRSGLFAAGLVAAGAIGFSSPSFAAAIGPNSPFQINPYNFDEGPLGKWQVSGGVSAWAAEWNNNAGGPGTIGAFSFDNAEFRLQGAKGQLSWDVWVGLAPNTPVLGYTSDQVGPNLYPFCTAGVSRGDTCGGPALFKGFVTWAPTSWFAIDAGRLSSPDGTEIGVDWRNPNIWLSDLNNMQTTTADGVEFDFINPANSGVLPHYGSMFSVMMRDGYHSWGHFSELGFVGIWNLNADGSNAIFGFGHTRLGHPLANISHGCVAVFGNACNANLVGFGAFLTYGNWLFNPEFEDQWLPKSSNSALGGTGNTSTYGNWAGQLTATYSFSPQTTLTAQFQYVAQYGDQNGTNANSLGNFLGLGAGPGVGTFGPGSNMLAFQINPSYQFGNLFIRPGIEYTHLSHFIAGDGYGQNGDKASQFVGLVEFGFLLGEAPKSVDKWGF